MAAPQIKEERKMLSLTSSDRIIILKQITPGKTTYGMCKCIHAPSWCWCCAALPCCKLPKDVVDKMEDSKYVYVRENSIEW
jgi:hypothetical protein